MKWLVTGATGFIGSYFIKHVLNHSTDTVVGITRNVNQRNFMRLEDYCKRYYRRFKLLTLDFAKDDVSEIFDNVDMIVHFGAKTFVDHSIRDPKPFIESNIVGTYNLLESARRSRQLNKFFMVSTDEVYGAISEGSYKETDKLNPTNPYSATKAAAEMLCISYHNTYGLPVIITRTENNYGPYQGPEKAIPTFIRKACADQLLPVYGDGNHVRQWLHIEDHVRGILFLSERKFTNEIFHIAGHQELKNIDLAKKILKLCGKPEDRIQFIDDSQIRQGHDRRYALNVQKLRALGWKPKYDLDSGLNDVVNWYLQRLWWIQ